MLHALTLNFLSFYLCKSHTLIYFKGVFVLLFVFFFSFLALTFILKVQNANIQAMEIGKQMYFYKNMLLYSKNVTEGLSFFSQVKRMQAYTITGEGKSKRV